LSPQITKRWTRRHDGVAPALVTSANPNGA
jgi:hypothetical protein